jgi:hypothetical protein
VKQGEIERLNFRKQGQIEMYVFRCEVLIIS